MPLARFDAPFEHPDWIFEPKLDGFRAVAYVEGGACRLVSRNRNAFKTFVELARAIGEELSGRSAILDGEIVRPGPDGRPIFYGADAPARAVLLLCVRSALAGRQGPAGPAAR
jgi:ATP-dependent DNA ligase